MAKIVIPVSRRWPNYLANLRVFWIIYRLLLPLVLLQVIELLVLGPDVFLSQRSFVLLALKKMFIPVGGSIAIYLFLRDFIVGRHVTHYKISKMYLNIVRGPRKKEIKSNISGMNASCLKIGSSYNVLIYQRFSSWLGDFKIRTPVVLFSLTEEDANCIVSRVNTSFQE